MGGDQFLDDSREWTRLCAARWQLTGPKVAADEMGDKRMRRFRWPG